MNISLFYIGKKRCKNLVMLAGRGFSLARNWKPWRRSGGGKRRRKRGGGERERERDKDDGPQSDGVIISEGEEGETCFS